MLVCTDLRIYLHGIYVLEETRELTRFITVESLRNCLAEFGAAVQTSPNQATTTIILGDLDRDTRSAQWAGSRAETVFHKEVERREARGGQEDIDLYESLSDFIDAYQGSGLRESVAAHAFIADFRHDERLKKPSRDPGPSR